MPMATKELQKEYQRNWIAKRRADFFDGKKCEWCGSTEGLELHHRDPKTKVHHRVWSWAEKRRSEEIAKCIVLCGNCHRKHHANQRRKTDHGVASRYKKGCRCRLCLEAQYRTMRKPVRDGETASRRAHNP